MKKLLVFLLALILLAPAALATDLGLEEKELTLWQKFDKQLRDGSGLRGTLTVQMQGDTLLSALLGEGMDGVSADITHILTDKLAGHYQTGLTFLQNGAAVTTAQLDGRDDALSFSGQLFESAFTVKTAQLLDGLFPDPSGQGRSPFEPMLYRLFFSGDAVWEKDMLAALDPYQVRLEKWLAGYADIQNFVKEGRIQIDYAIPARDAADQLKLLLPDLLEDGAFRAVLERKLAPEDSQVYFSADSLAFYLLALDHITLSGDIRITQTMAIGEQASGGMAMRLPLAANGYGIQTIAFEQQDGQAFLSLEMDAGTLSLAYAQTAGGDISGFIRLIPPLKDDFTVSDKETRYQSQSISAAFALVSGHREWTDEEGKNNSEDSYTLHLAPDFSHIEAESQEERDALILEYLDFAPTTFTLTAALRSGASKTSATTLIVEIGEQKDDAVLKLHFEGKTAAPWQTLPVDLTAAQALSGEAAKETLVNALNALLIRFTPAMAQPATAPAP